MSADDTTHAECALCDSQVLLNDTAEAVHIDDDMAFDAGIDVEGPAHKRCYDQALERHVTARSEREHARQESAKYGLA